METSPGEVDSVFEAAGERAEESDPAPVHSVAEITPPSDLEAAVADDVADAETKSVILEFGLGYGRAAARVKEFPHKPGVYLMKDSTGRVIYIGKAKSLRSRAGSYFLKAAAERDSSLARGVGALRTLMYGG